MSNELSVYKGVIVEKVKVKQHIMGNWEAFIAINNGQKILIEEMLVMNKLNPNLDFRGTTLLTTAIHQNSLEIVQILLEHNANPNKKSKENDRYEPPIITATRLKYINLVRILVENGAQLSLTNFYGEDAIYQAVVTNAFEILIYFLSKKSHGSCIHKSERNCPFLYAIFQGENYPSKRKCLFIFFKYHYICSCWKFNANRKNLMSHIINSYKNKKIKKELCNWIYLSYGINLYSLMPIIEKKNTKEDLPPPSPSLSPLQINLYNLVRISIRNKISKIAIKRRSSFCDEILKLPLPSIMIKFLLMNDLPI